MIESLETRRCMSATADMDVVMITADAPTETAVELSWSELNQAVKDAAGAVVNAMTDVVTNYAILQRRLF